jgi:hypothetical protein
MLLKGSTDLFGFQPGDHIAAPRLLGYTHHGIYVGNGRVIHYQEKGYMIDETSFDAFKGSFPTIPYKVNHPKPKFSPSEIVDRARSRIGEQKYSISECNCEHFCNWCVDGIETSEQVGFAMDSLVAGTMKHILSSIDKTVIKHSVFNAALVSIPKSSQFIKTIIPNSSQTVGRVLSYANIPIMLGLFVREAYPTIKRFFKGEINSRELLEGVGEKGATFFSGMYLGTVAQAIIPIPIIGFLAGSTIGYTLSSLVVHTLLSSLKEAKQARENYLRTKEECEKLQELMRQYRKDTEIYFNKYFTDLSNTLYNCMDTMDKSIASGDLDSFAKSANEFADKLGTKLQFSTFKEFQDFRRSGKPLEL